MKLPFPDNSTDTMYCEVFYGKFAFLYDPLNMKPFLHFCSGWFSLSNRVFYYFRLLLGYRLSTIINFFIICVSYYKVKEFTIFFFKYIDEKKYGNFNKNFSVIIPCLIAFAALFKEYILLGSIIIKGDLFVIPLFFECVLLLFKMKNTGKFHAYAGLLIGLSITLKLTNIVFFIPIVVYYFIKEHSNLRIKNILITLIFCILPLLPYMVHNTIITGNPVYPFYNGIFKSPYYPIINYKDNRWGPETIFETIFWPIILLFNQTRFSELGINSHSLAIGYLVTLLVILLQKKIQALKKIVPICVCLFCSILLWSITTGYARYVIPLEVFSIILMSLFIYTIWNNYFKGAKYLIFCCCFSVLFSLGICANNLTSPYWDWSWRPSVFTDLTDYINRAKPNLKYIFNDRIATDNPITKHKLNLVRTWVCLGNNAYSTLANSKANFFLTIWNASDIVYLDSNTPEKFTKDYFESHSNEGLYSIIDNFDERIFKLTEAYGFTITNYEEINLNYTDASIPVYLVSIMQKNQAEISGIKGISLEDMK
jgi:hypothetical protein